MGGAGIITDFLSIQKTLTHYSDYSQDEKKAYFSSNENPNIMLANMTPDQMYFDNAIINGVRSFFEGLYAQHSGSHNLVGFKEVRYGEEEILLLRKCFPQAIIILLVRHPLDVWNSMSTSFYECTEDFSSTWNKHALQYAKLHNESKGIYMVRYEDIINQAKESINLLSNLAKVSVKEINNVLSVKLFSTASIKDKDELNSIWQYCLKGMESLGYN